MTNSKIRPGVTVHFLEPRTLVLSTDGLADGRLFLRGDSLVLSEAAIAGNRDRFGTSPLDRVGEEGFGIQFGAWPTDVPTWQPGTSEEDEAREAARKAAWGLDTEQARQEALAVVHRDFRSPPGPSVTHYGSRVE